VGKRSGIQDRRQDVRRNWIGCGLRSLQSFKCTPEKFAELIEKNGIVPAPYVARYHWVALERFNALSEKELKTLLRTAYDLVLAKLPKKLKAQLA
jgi:predicted DNA-binding protein (MmcQ/YjbR family)